MAFKMKGAPYRSHGGPHGKRRNYSKNVIDATVENTTKGLGPHLKNLIDRDSQRTMTQDRSKLNKIDRENDEMAIGLSETRQGERFMSKVMTPESIKSKPITEKTLKSPAKKKMKGLPGIAGVKAEKDKINELSKKNQKATKVHYSAGKTAGKSAANAAGKSAANAAGKTAGKTARKMLKGIMPEIIEETIPMPISSLRRDQSKSNPNLDRLKEKPITFTGRRY